MFEGSTAKDTFEAKSKPEVEKKLATLRQKLFMSKAKPFQIIQSLAATLVFVKVKNKLISIKALNSPTTMLLSCTVVR